MGAPLPLLTFRLEAVPEMGYNPLGNPPRGEIIIKGPVVFQGYYQVRACRPRKVPLTFFIFQPAAMNLVRQVSSLI